MVDATKNGGVTAIVEYDYTAKEPDELDLIKGAIIHSIKQMPGGWWEGTLQTNGKTGMFPDNFVRVVDMNEDNTVVLRDKTTTSNRRCKVIYSYTQVNDDELSLAVGDVIEFLGEVEEGWWRGRLKNKIGVFPSNFVKLIESSPVFASKRPPSQSKQITKSANNTVAATSSTLTASSASSISTAAGTKKINRLSFHNSKEDLLAAATTITSNNSSTLTSGTTVAATTTSSASSSSSLLLGGAGGDDAAPSLPPKPQRDYCRVEFPYAPQNDDELELKVGDIITIHSMDLPDKGWWKGELRGKIGVFPDNFVKLMAPSEVSPLNDLQQQQSQPQQTHRTTAKLTNTTNTTTTTNNLTTTTGATTSNVKSLIKKSGSSSSTQSSNRKDSFGSRDSLNDILSETGLPTGNVAAQRKSLENKNLDLTNASDVAARLALKKQHMQQQQQQQQESKTITSSISSNNNTTSTTSTLITTATSASSTSSSELRKSMENMDEKTTAATKTTPPPVLNKKPSVPVKKTTTVTSITGNILSGIKQKVKNVESKLTTAASHDYADGVGSSKLSPSYASDSGSGGVVMRRAATIAVEDTDFDRVERGSILPDMRAGRVKAPKRRPPSAAINAIGESNNNSLYVNGNGSDTTQSGDDQLKSDDNSTGEEQLAKPKPREWEKKKAPWMEELKASQVKKKTSPSVSDGVTATTDRSSKLLSEELKTTNNISSQVSSSMQATNSSTSATASSTKVQSSSVSSTSIMQQSMIVESSSSTTSSSSNTTAKTLSEAMTKSLSAKLANDVMAASNNTSLNNSSSGHVVDDVRARPNSLSIRNRSASPSMAATRNILKPNSVAANTTVNNSASPAEASSSNNTHHSSSTNTTQTSTVAKSSNLNSSSNHVLNNGGATTTAGSQHKIAELETRVDKLELLVHAQQRTIDELVRTLREETDRNKVLRAELDKYAQKPTRRGKFDNWMF
ncbi:serine-rich adhesin for platelets isoform X1 [Lucilia cuprina]|uniref:serine-rich adhesin for platelets isoform X1 n=1 Tax=Lucilia cuprina TaxID=7375 RepID=UPI001F0507E6|nr:serine-rich adhesin for platelets isoform X1 [Lucilia cuprina]XP_046806183.1 serine-rich adhesin for platelets isoform X1 [Lucilia cuprina]XP_046806184.1 serine-rich adhesin for platelets isoform X1 [Lucilia cuprina]XP_046806185.1 serine-rich adhesin for platelets isoform X1 [Lucilia cuprina]XP_046806186.1 serine-rich adhesin for platelets isoform X1 [Lucilia cuprina]